MFLRFIHLVMFRFWAFHLLHSNRSKASWHSTEFWNHFPFPDLEHIWSTHNSRRGGMDRQSAPDWLQWPRQNFYSWERLQASDSSYLCPVFLASTLKSDNVLLGTSKDRMCPITSIHRLNAEGRCYLHVWIRYNRYQNHKNLALRAIELLLNL